MSFDSPLMFVNYLLKAQKLFARAIDAKNFPEIFLNLKTFTKLVSPDLFNLLPKT